MAFLAGPWPARITWGLLPLLLGPALGDALAEHSLAVARTASGLAWVTWAGVLVAVVLPTTVSLTALRIAAPTALGVANWAAITGDAGVAGAVAVGGAALALVAAFSPLTGDVFIDGSSYGDERRFALRVPTALVFGPVPLAGIGAVAAPIAGPLLLAAEQWLAGAVVLAVGVPVAVVSVRALHGLARRWVVLVPAGLVLHDPHSLLEPVLFPRRTIARLGPAGADADPERRDLTQAALGLALELELVEPATISPRRSDRTVQVESVTRLTFTPSRPGALLAAASARRLPVRSARRRRAPPLAVAADAASVDVVGWRGGDGRRDLPRSPRHPPRGCGAGGSPCWWWGRWWPSAWWWSPRTRWPSRSPSRSGRPRGRGPSSPTRGLGAWVDVYDWTVELGGPVPSVDADDVDAMAEAGVQTLYIQTAHTPLGARPA